MEKNYKNWAGSYTYKVIWSSDLNKFVGICFEFPELTSDGFDAEKVDFNIRHMVEEELDKLEKAGIKRPKVISKPRNVLPGEVLEEQLETINMSVFELSKRISYNPIFLERLIKGLEDINADLAIRLSIFFDTTPEFWMNLQRSYDLKEAKWLYDEEYLLIVPLDELEKNK